MLIDMDVIMLFRVVLFERVCVDLYCLTWTCLCQFMLHDRDYGLIMSTDILDQDAQLDFYGASSLKQQSGQTSRSTRTHYPDSEVLPRAQRRSNKYQFNSLCDLIRRGSGPRSAALNVSALTIIPLMWFCDFMMTCHLLLYSHLYIGLQQISLLVEIIMVMIVWQLKLQLPM